MDGNESSCEIESLDQYCSRNTRNQEAQNNKLVRNYFFFNQGANQAVSGTGQAARFR